MNLRSMTIICLATVGCSIENTPSLCDAGKAHHGQFAVIPEGKFVATKANNATRDASRQSIDVSAFEMQVHEVTNAQFSLFVSQTQYETDVERGIRENNPNAGSALFVMPASSDSDSTLQANPSPGWKLAPKATWRTPAGPGTDLKGREYYPVIHVSLNDARAYAEWAGARLPSELEWEYVATLGLFDASDDRSGAYKADGTPIANTWQGVFPIMNTVEDGFEGLAPVGCFEPNRLGLFDMLGNVWEWTETPAADNFHIVKGGSFLCANNFCRRYRPAARERQESDFSTNHIGFRLVKDTAPISGAAF